MRSGTVMAVWDSSNIEYTDTSTSDIGDTNQVEFEALISGLNIELTVGIASGTFGTWSVKIGNRYI
tara:strand:+ start:2054 stop:2251 length:198 start_codon:yes stop_codon:yes gene_type:complete